MKKTLASIVLLFVVTSCFSQTDTIPDYKKFPYFPTVRFMMPDSTSYFTKSNLQKDKPVMVMVFSPLCEHCQHETEELIKNIDKFKDIQIVMSTSMPFDTMLNFIEKYKLAQYKNIIVVHDANFFLPVYYQLHNLPFLAFYNKKKELISVFEGSMQIGSVLGIFKD